ncbi:MAG: RDD family protein [Aurantibacter sp.]
MTREAQLQFCKVCVNHKKDLDLGIICGLNDKIADFGNQCESFHEDSSRKTRAAGITWSKGVDTQVASQGKRFANYIIDFICLLIFIVMFSFILGIILALIAPSTLHIFEEGNTLLEYAIGFVAGMIYYSTLESISGQSIGKAITRTKVVTETGEKPDFGMILLRSVCRYIPFDAFSFLGSHPIGWHDSISKTRVVPIDYNPEK